MTKFKTDKQKSVDFDGQMLCDLLSSVGDLLFTGVGYT